MGALLTLSPERIAREQMHALEAAEDERQRRRAAWLALGDGALWLASAYVLLFLSFWTTRQEWANVAFWAALALGNFGPVITGFRYWSRADT
ncbi:MAG: hypothetical protein EXR93_09845 [Gemmatimonadetes bacterium]|nr:hypothetical protein [Gemmatimonadota bacterium]